MDVASDFTSYQDRVTSALVNATKTTAQISAEDLTFYRSFDPKLSSSLDQQGERLLGLSNSILKVATSGSDLKPPVLEDEDSVEENWKGVVDVVDELLEKADACLDEFTGIIKKLKPADNDRSVAVGRKSGSTQFPSVYDHGRSQIAKPQLLFERRPDNRDTSPFKPLLQSKPHAIVPLSESLDDQHVDSNESQSCVHNSAPEENGPIFKFSLLTFGIFSCLYRYRHPYEVEITRSQYPSSVYASSTPQMYLPFESTTATFVDTMEGVESMLAELKAAKEIAVDLEHNDMRSYHGLVCLMQISTRDKDWIVDTLKPWREKLQILNEVFADSSILKVFHGSSMDIIWLQRDLGLYVVGLFDTYHAANALNYSKRSLKYLLEKIVNFQAEKRYQMADWRVRPLLPGMFDYARSDTHYLLYIYDHLRNELLEHSTADNNLINYVRDKSKEEALQRYERPVYDAATGKGGGGWYDVLSRSSVLFSREQFGVFKAVHQWRDETARAEDEGVQSVLSKQSLFRVAHAMPLDPPSLLRLVTPVSKALKERVSDLIAVIKNAKLAAVTGPELRDVLSSPSATTERPKLKVEGKLPPSASAAKGEVVRAATSLFWGPTVPEGYHADLLPTYSPSASLEAVRLSLPLPSVRPTISVGATVAHDEPSSAESVEPAPAKSSSKQDPSSEVFTVKQFGAPKKRKTGPSPGEAETSDSVAAIPEENEISVALPRRNKKKKKKHSTGSGVRGPDEDSEQGGQDSSPFDYSTAKSVLHANAGQQDKVPDKKGMSRQFNPYAKVLDAPSGLRKTKKDMGGGKSYTFK